MKVLMLCEGKDGWALSPLSLVPKYIRFELVDCSINFLSHYTFKIYINRYYDMHFQADKEISDSNTPVVIIAWH